MLARRVLLDALDALGAHRDALVLVGAQAVYLRVGEADLAVAPFTTDGDLAVDPARLAEVPPLEAALMAAGFRPKSHDSVGVWITRRQTAAAIDAEVAVDLLVPAAASPGSGRRAARLRGHDPRVARIVRGLEGAMVDEDVMTLAALETADARSFNLRIAGPAALLVAKVHKIAERQATDRQIDKDALDVLRLLRGTETAELARRFERLLADARSTEPAQLARDHLRRQFATRTGIGVTMAIRAVGALGDPDEIAASCEALTQDLLTACPP